MEPTPASAAPHLGPSHGTLRAGGVAFGCVTRAAIGLRPAALAPLPGAAHARGVRHLGRHSVVPAWGVEVGVEH
jgi:hypothetical protein